MHVPISSDADRRCERRRVVARAHGIAPATPYVATTIGMLQPARAREPLRAVALTVFAAHAAIMAALWHAWVPDGRTTLPRALAVEVDASESARVAEPGVHRRVAVATQVPPERMPSHPSRETAVHRAARPSVAATRQADLAGPSRKLAAAIDAVPPDGERRRTMPEQEPAQPAAAHAAADAATVPARATPVAQSSAAPEPVTAPRFAAAYLRNPGTSVSLYADRNESFGTVAGVIASIGRARVSHVAIATADGNAGTAR
ncbi:hypothetical protein BDI24065_06045 [Burkholderia diffusa]|uniref:Uncharacterized protein n=2 Tax=Burkholderia diffusa TaxID=488732 RepID=A0A6P2QWI0_9BURK|nr:hypothetical protein BDI24065_06045 [Burkholderia diffusa]